MCSRGVAGRVQIVRARGDCRLRKRLLSTMLGILTEPVKPLMTLQCTRALGCAPAVRRASCGDCSPRSVSGGGCAVDGVTSQGSDGPAVRSHSGSADRAPGGRAAPWQDGHGPRHHGCGCRHGLAGVDTTDLLVIAALAAFTSAVTSVGHRTNTMAHGAGAYRFTDFVRIGMPLNLLSGSSQWR